MIERSFFNSFLKLSKNKVLELQSGIWQEYNYFDFVLKWNKNIDHAGFVFSVELFGFYFIFQIYDKRHWNYDYNCWEGQQPKPTKETHPNNFNEDGTMKKFVPLGVSTIQYD